jgi:hypothetical protein
MRSQQYKAESGRAEKVLTVYSSVSQNHEHELLLADFSGQSFSLLEHGFDGISRQVRRIAMAL